MANYGLKVSVPGEDVKTATDINLSLKSDLTLLKVFSFGTATMSGDQEISHNLGYIPQFIAFVTDGTDSYLATGHTSYAVARIDSAKLYIKDTLDGGGATSAKYYIFYEQT